MGGDRGSYEPEDGADRAGAQRRGRLKVTLKGRKLEGAGVLVRTGGRRRRTLRPRMMAARAAPSFIDQEVGPG